MSKSEWGVKRRCAKCEVPFYDMLRYPIRCPKCGAAFSPDAATSRRSLKRSSKKVKEERAPRRAAPVLVAAKASDSHDSENEVELDDEDNGIEADDDDDAVKNDDEDVVEADEDEEEAVASER